jgi:hypothetical protein
MKYYIGDLCYILSDDDYAECIASEENQWNKTSNGTIFAWGSTAYGDGLYLDNVGNEYPVDAGLIGIVKLDDSFEPKDGYSCDDGNVFVFRDQPRIKIENGVFTFGNIIINTKDEEDCE